ncbi:MAG: tryptophan 2,3-dioxygenase family protein [Planctomycetia bacterium]
MSAGRTTYWDYIRVEPLLRLQGGLGEDDAELGNAELTFITVHQVYELWFKLLLRELATVRDLLAAPHVPETRMAQGVRSLDRMQRIFRAAVQHWEVVESLNTTDYLDFREKLFPASGFQSAQLREIEVLMGLGDEERVGLGAQGAWLKALRGPSGETSPALARVEARRKAGPTLREALEAWLWRTPIRGSVPGDAGDESVVRGFLDEYGRALGVQSGWSAWALGSKTPEDPRLAEEMRTALAWLSPEDPRRRRIRAAILFIEGYRDLPLLAWPHQLLSGLVEVEQLFIIFRQRHARMVERIIGRRMGTGGSSGLAYLEQTATAYRIFADLWASKTLLVQSALLPPLADPGPYQFRREGPPGA